MPSLESERDREVAALFTLHYDSLRRLAAFLLSDPVQGEEVVMDCFAKALSRWKMIGAKEDPHLYLRRMVINSCRSKQRRTALENRIASLFKRQDDHQIPIELHGVALDVWGAVEKLPMRQRAVIVLRYLEDLKESEIAEVMDSPVGTVKSLHHRAKKQLSNHLGPDFFGGGA